ncbi:MAG TPA: hypothetical protein VMW03_08475 [Candidatus Krumholzibacteriaceae bacterium]|nr:hypothetical protein [Candidatus Krumholzibacteriaceae bacterium]
MVDVEASGGVIRIRFKEHENLLGMTDGFALPVENLESVSTAKMSCKYPRMGGFGTRDGMVFYYMEDGDKVVTLSLRGHRYSKVMVEVKDKEAVAEAIRKSIQR